MTEHPVEARGLVKRYGEIAAVDGVDLKVRAGEIYGFLAPNGAGKATTLRILVSLIRPNAAAVAGPRSHRRRRIRNRFFRSVIVA